MDIFVGKVDGELSWISQLDAFEAWLAAVGAVVLMATTVASAGCWETGSAASGELGVELLSGVERAGRPHLDIRKQRWISCRQWADRTQLQLTDEFQLDRRGKYGDRDDGRSTKSQATERPPIRFLLSYG